MLTLASVIGREFSVEALRRASGLEEDELFEALEEAAAVRLVADVPGASGRMRFSHILVRDVLYDEPPGATPAAAAQGDRRDARGPLRQQSGSAPG